MFFTYLGHELRRRRKQAFVVSLGLALGIALVVVVTAMAAGVRDAQSAVLHSLYGVGTDITVTEAAEPGADPGGPIRLGRGDEFSNDQLVTSPGQDTFNETRVASVARADGVATAAGGLTLTSIHIEGDLPTFDSGSGGSGGDTSVAAPGAAATPTFDPGQLDVASVSIAGVDVTNEEVGPVSPDRLTDGRAFDAADAHAAVAVLDKAYAKQEDLAVGDTLTLSDTDFTVVGLATTTAQGAGSDIYLPLARAQTLANLKGRINTIYVKANDSTSIATAKAAIKNAFPDATASTASDLAAQTSGSLSSASNLASTLGRWLAIAVLGAAIVLASLLTLSSVGRRTRELGTLKALGWRTRRVVGQVMGETVVQGVIGGALGLALGIAGAWIVTQVAPSLTATVSTLGSGGGAVGVGPGGAPGAAPFADTVSVALTAPIGVSLAAAAIVLSIVGGLVAGSVGGWRAARLRPADAMRRVV